MQTHILSSSNTWITMETKSQNTPKPYKCIRQGDDQVPVNVFRSFPWGIILYDVLDFWKVQASSSNIGWYKNCRFLGTKTQKWLFAIILLHITMQTEHFTTKKLLLLIHIKLWARAPFKLAEYCVVEINRVTGWQENNNL